MKNSEFYWPLFQWMYEFLTKLIVNGGSSCLARVWFTNAENLVVKLCSQIWTIGEKGIGVFHCNLFSHDGTIIMKIEAYRIVMSNIEIQNMSKNKQEYLNRENNTIRWQNRKWMHCTRSRSWELSFDCIESGEHLQRHKPLVMVSNVWFREHIPKIYIYILYIWFDLNMNAKFRHIL